MPEVTPFAIAASDDELADLKRRLTATLARCRNPGRLEPGYPARLHERDCRVLGVRLRLASREALLNQWPGFRTEVEGLGIHFLHVESKVPGARPLLMTHGWPGSIVEFQKVIGPLTDPEAHGGNAEDAFTLIAPTLPGFGYTDKPTEPGWGIEKIATAPGTR